MINIKKTKSQKKKVDKISCVTFLLTKLKGLALNYLTQNRVKLYTLQIANTATIVIYCF